MPRGFLALEELDRATGGGLVHPPAFLVAESAVRPLPAAVAFSPVVAAGARRDPGKPTREIPRSREGREREICAHEGFVRDLLGVVSRDVPRDDAEHPVLVPLDERLERVDLAASDEIDYFRVAAGGGLLPHEHYGTRI